MNDCSPKLLVGAALVVVVLMEWRGDTAVCKMKLLLDWGWL